MSAPTGESKDTAIAIACPPILEMEIAGIGRTPILKLKLKILPHLPASV